MDAVVCVLPALLSDFSFRDVEEMLAMRGVVLTYETVWMFTISDYAPKLCGSEEISFTVVL